MHCQQHGITPIVCVDAIQELVALGELPADAYVAYELPDAIGTGAAASIEHIADALTQGHALTSGTKILYGGSVNRGNVRKILSSAFCGWVAGGAGGIGFE